MKSHSILILVLEIAFLAGSNTLAKYSGGTGEPNDPYKIATKADLLALTSDTNDYSKNFVLTADVNMEGQVFTAAIIAPDTNSSSGFQGTAFTGAFDGNSHKITNFTINGGSNWYPGLFGCIGSGGSVKNLGTENFAASGYCFVGGLVGENYGTITECYSTGAVSGSGEVGGLVGFNWDNGSISDCYSTGTVSSTSEAGGLVGINEGSISSCYSTGTVSGSNVSLGGLVGYNNSGSISNCYSRGMVSGVYCVGGLVGYNNSGSISNCYSTGTVSGSQYVGGLVGYIYSTGSISQCYSTGAVSDTSDVGGLVGYNPSGSVINSFWDKQTSGRTTSAGGTGKTTAEMKTRSTFTSAGWDFVEIWGIGENQTYPFLRDYCGPDLNYDGLLNFADFAIFAQYWLEGVTP
jgi:hypothetical protein